MKLKIKNWDWSAGLPVAMLNKTTAEKLSVHPEDRISIRTTGKKRKEVSTLIDTINGAVDEDHIAISSELKEYFNFQDEELVEVNPSNIPDSLLLIKKKMNSKILTEKEINTIIKDVVTNNLSEAEIALFVTSVYKNGMNKKETISLINAILKSGAQLHFSSKIVADKHCIGGVPGNRTTPIVVAICAAAGLTIPKNSSKAITSAAGTSDVIETIAQVEFSLHEMKKIVQKTGACMVWGGALELVPADSKLIRVEKSLKIDPEPILIASIMSKKIAAGSNRILIDIPYGAGGKMTKKKALELKRKFEEFGKHYKKKFFCVLTDGSQPIGNGIGPALELRDIVKILDIKNRDKITTEFPEDLEKKSLFLAGQLLELCEKAKKNKGMQMAKEILYSGKAFNKFKEIIVAQKGSLKKLDGLGISHTIYSSTSGKVIEINNFEIASLARMAGCPLDKFSGVYLHCHVGTKIKPKQKILTLYAESKSKLNDAITFYKKTKPVKIK